MTAEDDRDTRGLYCCEWPTTTTTRVTYEFKQLQSIHSRSVRVWPWILYYGTGTSRALRQRAVPIFGKPFLLAFAMHEAVEKKLERYVESSGQINLGCPNRYCQEAGRHDSNMRRLSNYFSSTEYLLDFKGLV
ncbi:hypothetical protein T01_15464 [Trichinella spiralis]|uniref:Uncharacterized protein n=1 Tax=Trichinella spiralis TaxID=6334 RepID=A0A0V1B3D6_TRISP|nr:hypothetical protein T01_15464 [Trichinella spiralis]